MVRQRSVTGVGQALGGGRCTVGVPSLHTHSTSAFRNVKATLAVNRVPADSGTVLSVLMGTAVKTAR